MVLGIVFLLAGAAVLLYGGVITFGFNKTDISNDPVIDKTAMSEKSRYFISRYILGIRIIAAGAAAAFLGFILIFTSRTDCLAEGSKYYVSPQGNHAAHHFYESCGGATVGFTQVVDLDGVEVFTTYGGGKDNAIVKWASDNVLQIEYPLTLSNVRAFKPRVGDVEIQLVHKGELVTEQTISDAQSEY